MCPYCLIETADTQTDSSVMIILEACMDHEDVQHQRQLATVSSGILWQSHRQDQV